MKVTLSTLIPSPPSLAAAATARGLLYAAGSAETVPSQQLESPVALWGVSSQGQGWSGHARDRHHPDDKGELDVLLGTGTALQPHTRTKPSQTLCVYASPAPSAVGISALSR